MKMLRTLLSERTWHYALGFDLDVDFSFWILERDGLKIPPFDRHGEGDGMLRAAGLDAASWSAWFARVLAAVDERRKIVTSSRTKQIDFARLRALEPAALWNGAPAVGQQLALLAEEYDEILSEREIVKLELIRIGAECGARLWRELAPYRRVLPPVNIIVICYSGPIQVAVPPSTILLTAGGWELTPRALDDAIMKEMRSLAEDSRPWPFAD